MTLDPSNVTWGISASGFLAGYLLLAVVVVGYAAVRRRQILAGPESVRTSTLSADQVGYLNGGERLAIYTALAGLRHAGAIAIGPAPDRYLELAGDRPVGASGLEAAVHRFAGQRRRPQELIWDSGVSMELTRLRTGLERAGLMPGDEVRRALRTPIFLLAGVLLLGVLRLLAVPSTGEPRLPLILALVGLGVATMLLGRRPPTRTRAGNWALHSLRTGNAHLAPAQQPAWNTYGPTGAAMSVALFGPAAFWAADPEFAAEAGIQQRLNAVSSTGSGGDSGSSSGDFACSVGGYGSDSSGGGGSSCGGGGGGCGGGGGS